MNSSKTSGDVLLGRDAVMVGHCELAKHDVAAATRCRAGASPRQQWSDSCPTGPTPKRSANRTCVGPRSSESNRRGVELVDSLVAVIRCPDDDQVRRRTDRPVNRRLHSSSVVCDESPRRGTSLGRRASWAPGPAVGYQPDYFDDAADMRNWQQNRDRQSKEQRARRRADAAGRTRQRSVCANGPPNEQPFSTEDQAVRRERQRQNQEAADQAAAEAQRDLERRVAEARRYFEQERLDFERREQEQEERLLFIERCHERNMQRQREIDEEKRKLLEMKQRLEANEEPEGQEQCETPARSSAAAAAAAACVVRTPGTNQQQPPSRHRVAYIPPSPLSDTEGSSADESATPFGSRQLPTGQKKRLQYQPSMCNDTSSSSSSSSSSSTNDCPCTNGRGANDLASDQAWSDNGCRCDNCAPASIKHNL